MSYSLDASQDSVFQSLTRPYLDNTSPIHLNNHIIKQESLQDKNLAAFSSSQYNSHFKEAAQAFCAPK